MPTAPRANHLLAALRPEDLQRIESQLEETTLELGQVLFAPGRSVTHVYFPTTALVSVLCSTYAGDSIEVAMTGPEGVVGPTFASNGQWAHGRVVVQRGGGAFRLPSSIMHREFLRGGALQLLTLRYGELQKAQMAQTALCGRMHKLEEQLCRWILMSLDRCDGMRLAVTQQQVASMLGVRREGVSAAVRRLQEEGLLHWGRGRLQVTDRVTLEARCCECYGAIRSTSQRLFGLNPRPQ